MLTKEDYKKIKQYLLSRSVKDSELPVSKSLSDKDTIPIVQNNKNVQVPINTFINDISYMGLSNIYNVSILSNNYKLSLQEAIELVPKNARKNGIIVMYFQYYTGWVVYRYHANNITGYDDSHYLNIENWVDFFEPINNRLHYIDNRINTIDDKVRTTRTYLNLTEDAFKFENWGDWQLNITFSALKELVETGTIIQVYWDNKLCIDSAYYADEDSIHLRFDNIDYSNAENPYHNFVTLALTSGSSFDKVNIRRYYINPENQIINVGDGHDLSIKTINELMDLYNSGRYKIIYKTYDHRSYIISNLIKVGDTLHSYISELSHYDGKDDNILHIIVIEFKQIDNGIDVKLGRKSIPLTEQVPILDELGKIPTSYLPNYTDDVLDLIEILDALPQVVSYDKDVKFGIVSPELQGPKGIYVSNGRGQYKKIEDFSVDKLYLVNKESNVQGVIPPMSIVKWTGEHIVVLNKSLTLGSVEGTAFDGKRGKDNEDLLNSHINNKANPHSVTKGQVGLGNITNDAQVKRSEMGTANGVALLDINGKLKDENLDIINVPNIENHYGILVKKNMTTPDSISVVEASEIYKQFQSISPKSNNCIIKAGSASNINGTIQYNISAKNNPKFNEVLDAYNRGANIILDTFIDNLEVDRHQITINNWYYNNDNILHGVVFACEDFNHQTIDITIIKSGDDIQGNFKILDNFANERLAGLMSADNYADIINCKNAITNIKTPFIININYANNKFHIVNKNKEFGEKFKEAINDNLPIKFHISNFYPNTDEGIIIVDAISTNKIIDSVDDTTVFPTKDYSAHGIFNDYSNNTIKLDIIYNDYIFEWGISAYVDKFTFSIKDENGKPIVTGVPNVLDIVEVEYDAKLIQLINDKTVIVGKNLDVFNLYYDNFKGIENEIIFTTFNPKNNIFVHSFLNKLFQLGINKKDNSIEFSIVNGGILEDLIKDVNELKHIDDGDGEILVTGGSNPFIVGLSNNGFDITYNYSSPIIGKGGENTITIPVAGNTTMGLLPIGYKSKIDTIGVKVNSLNNFGLVGKILVKITPEGFIDGTSTVYLLTGNTDIAELATSSITDTVSIKIPKSTINITNIGIEYTDSNSSMTNFNITSNNETENFVINITHIEMQNKQPIIINLYNL